MLEKIPFYNKLRDKVDHIIKDFADKLPISLQSSETKIKTIANEYEEKISRAKIVFNRKLELLNDDLRRISLDITIDEQHRQDLIQQKNQEIQKLNDDFANDMENMKRERERELLRIAQRDIDEIKRIQREKEDEIERLESENEEYIAKLQARLDDEISMHRKQTRDAIDRIKRERERELQKYQDEYQRLNEKYLKTK